MLARREQAICPHCGQRVLMRHGVKLSPLAADLFDMIERSGERGVPTEVLLGVFWPGRPTATARNSLKTTIYHMNGLFAGTDIEVGSCSGGGGFPYRVRRRARP